MIKKILISIAVILVLAIASIFIYGRMLSRQALPDYSKAFNIKGLTDSVWVYRDSFAMPHVYAKNAEDLYRVTGYLIAQDRLWQMDLLRHVTTGRLCEIFGKDLLQADILMRSLRIPEKSERIYAESTPEIKSIFEAYSDGINQYMEEHKDELPLEFSILGYKPEPWKPQHSFNLVGYMAWDLNGSWIAEIVLHKLKNKFGRERVLELVPMFDSTLSVIFPEVLAGNMQDDWGSEMINANKRLQQLGLSVFYGSNNWAVNSSKSANGKPILANDMHLGLMAPGVWYQMHQVIDGELNVTGVMLPGAPFIISGHNNAVAWGMTNVMNDDIDFYSEELNPADSTQYKLDGQWKPLIQKHEKIAVKGGDTILKTLKFTHRGPIISELKNVHSEPISMHWLGNEWSDEIRAVYLLNRARNWDDFKNALSSFVAVSQNIVYADTAGNIGLYCAAGVPLRKGPAWEVLSGNTSDFDWKGMVPFDSLPHYYNPAAGIAASANNKTAPADYPHYISHWYDLPFRYNRIKNMLLETNKHTAESFKAIQTDFNSENVRFYLPKAISVLENSVADGLERDALTILKNWNRSMDASEAAPAIYETFFSVFLKSLFEDEMGEEMFKEFIGDKVLVRNAIHRVWTTEKSSFMDNVSTTQIREDFSLLVYQSFRNAVMQLSEKYGEKTDRWKWGEMHQVVINHPLGTVKMLDKAFHLNRGPFEIGGSFHTVEPYSYKYAKPFESTHGASQRHVYMAGNWDESWTIIPTGISGVSSSPHYCDQTELYIHKKYRRDWFTREAVMQNAKYKVVIRP
jgi:penicillin amidase